MATGTVLITGAAGFIGSHVSEALLARGRRVVGVDNLDPFYDESLKRANLADIERGAGGAFVFERADIRDESAMRRALEKHKPETVIHLAAKAGVRPSIAEPGLYAHVNVVGTTVLFEAARRAGCSRVLMASSSSVYGNSSASPFREDEVALEPISPYAATKRACEMLAHTYHHLYKMEIACLRFFTAYGPRQRPDLAIMSFMRKMAKGEPIPMFGDGTMSRDFTHISDIAAGVLASECAIGKHGMRVWNLGGSRPVSVREMIEAIARVTGIEPRVERKPEQPGDVQRTCADTSRSREELGFEAKIGFEDGLRTQWEWLRSRG